MSTYINSSQPELPKSVSIAGEKRQDGMSPGAVLQAAAKRLRTSSRSKSASPITVSEPSPTRAPLMPHEERQALIMKPFPIVRVIGRAGSWGGVEIDPDERLANARRGTTRKPSLGEYEGE